MHGSRYPEALSLVIVLDFDMESLPGVLREEL
jgi:hypothetical protein